MCAPKYPNRPLESTGPLQPTPTLLSGQKPRDPHPIGPRVLQQHWETDTHMITNEVGKLLTATEVAEMLHLHVNTVKRLGDRGEIPFYRVCKRGDRRFRYDDVLDFLRRAK
jgi:excisionase family DNA binding protein